MSMRDISAKTPGGTLGYAQAKLRRNLRLDTVAEYLDSMGYELVVTVRKVEGKQGLSKSRETP
jgi:hypothetical protein